MKQGANIEVRDDKEYTPLLAAILKGCTIAVKQLLNLGANIKAVDAEGKHGAHYAADQNDYNIMKVLMEVSYS